LAYLFLVNNCTVLEDKNEAVLVYQILDILLTCDVIVFLLCRTFYCRQIPLLASSKLSWHCTSYCTHCAVYIKNDSDDNNNNNNKLRINVTMVTISNSHIFTSLQYLLSNTEEQDNETMSFARAGNDINIFLF